jgi:hypothetical protein
MAAGSIPEQELEGNMPTMLMAAKTISLLFMSKHQILRRIQTQFLAILFLGKDPLPNFNCGL